MISALITLIIVIAIVAVVAYALIYCLDQFPMAPPVHQILRALIILVAVLFILNKALPLLGMHGYF